MLYTYIIPPARCKTSPARCTPHLGVRRPLPNAHPWKQLSRISCGKQFPRINSWKQLWKKQLLITTFENRFLKTTFNNQSLKTTFKNKSLRIIINNRFLKTTLKIKCIGKNPWKHFRCIFPKKYLVGAGPATKWNISQAGTIFFWGPPDPPCFRQLGGGASSGGTKPRKNWAFDSPRNDVPKMTGFPQFSLLKCCARGIIFSVVREAQYI